MKHYDGMLATVESKEGKYLYLSTRIPTLKNFFKYEQVGIYFGDTTGIETTDIVKVYFYNRTWKSIIKERGFVKGLLEIWKDANIERVEFVKAGPRPKGLMAELKFWVSN